MKTGIQKVSIYDPTDGTVVQFDNVSTEAEFNIAGLETENAKGQMLYSGDESMFEFLSLELTGYDQLKIWMEAETDLNMVVLGVDDNILWYEPAKITVRKNYLSAVANRNGLRVKISKKGGSHAIYSGANLLHLLNGWADVGENGIADGYTQTGTYTPTFVDDEQRIAALASASGLLFTAGDLIFPIANAKVQFSVNPTLVTNGTGLNVSAVCKTFDDDTLQTDTETIATGLIELTTPATCYKLTINCLSGTVGGSNLTYYFKYPYFGVQRGAHVDLPY